MDPNTNDLLLHLREIARKRGTTTYGKIAPLVGLDMESAHDRAFIGQILGEISESEHQEGRPLISALVVSNDKMIPGQGFFNLAKRIGLHSTEDNDAFYFGELRRVHDYWSNRQSESQNAQGS